MQIFRKNPKKIQKNVDLISSIVSHIDAVMKEGEKIKITPLSKEIILQNGRSPHVHTIKNKLIEGSIWKDVLQNIKLHWKKKKGKEDLVEIEKIIPDKNVDFVRKEIREKIANMENKLESIEEEIKKLRK